VSEIRGKTKDGRGIFVQAVLQGVPKQKNEFIEVHTSRFAQIMKILLHVLPQKNFLSMTYPPPF